jgi:ATP-dependent Clp protease ATP-binding subunit ClpX
VQHALLKLIEGAEVRVKGDAGYVTVDTKNILFICAGAFEGIEKVINDRKHAKGIGFGFDAVANKDLTKSLSNLLPEDLMKFGMIREFVGRLHLPVILNHLSEEDLTKIIVEPKNSILKQFQEMFKLDGAKLTVSNEYIKSIAKNAFNRKTGARGLRTEIESKLIDTQFRLPSLVKTGIKEINLDDSGNIQLIQGNTIGKKRKDSISNNSVCK